MLDQLSRNGALPRHASSPAAGFPANLERDMDLLLSLLGRYPAPPDLAVYSSSNPTDNNPPESYFANPRAETFQYMIKYARSLLLQGNDFVVYVASCRLNAYHAQLAASRKIKNFEKLQVWDKIKFLLRANALDRKSEQIAMPSAQLAAEGASEDYSAA